MRKGKLSRSATVDMDVSKYSGKCLWYFSKADYKWAVDINRLTLTLLGIWPENNETKSKKIMTNVRVIVMLNLVLWGCVIPCLHALIKIWGDIMLIIDNLQYTLPFAMAVMKLFIMWRKRKDILPLLNMIKHDWLKPKPAKERDVMIKHARIARAITIFGCYTMVVTFILGAILPIFGISMRYLTNRTDSDRLLPLQSYYMYDKNKSPFFEMTYILQCVGAAVGGAIYTGIDCFLGVLIFHICGQLENLKARVTELDKFDNIDSALSHNIRDHKRLIRSINKIDNIFNMMLLGALFYFGTLFAFYGFLFATIKNENHGLPIARLIFIMTVSTNLFAHVCLYCAIGEILIARCEGIYDAACQYKWYTLQPRKARNLLFIMIRAGKALHLTAGKLFPMNMSTLCNLLKTSGGYVSVLLAHRQ